MTELSEAVHYRPASPGPSGPAGLVDKLRLAASRGLLEVVKDLLAVGSTLDPDKDGRTPLHFSAQEGHADVCALLVTHGCQLDSQDMMGYSPLLRAASQGAYDAAEVLLERGCDVNLQDEHGNAAIHEACWNGFSKTAELLVKYDCDVFLTNKAGFTALHLAAQNGHNESSRVLLYSGCNPDLKNNYGDMALHTAARYGHAGVARILISAKCKISEQNKNGDTALHIAAALKRRKIAKILVDSGIDVDLLNKQKETALEVARRKEHPEIELIISNYAKPRPCPSYPRRENFNVTFKEDFDLEDGPVVCPEDQPPLKPNPKGEKQEKERRFFFFKRKKKDKEKDKPTNSPSTNDLRKTTDSHQDSKTAVHGFFSRYVPRDGIQLYRDLAGNIKQGPIGYAPVCQCGPLLKRLENTIADTHDSLHNHVDNSHQMLAQRIENLDIRTSQQAFATNAMMEGRLKAEHNHCHDRISQRLEVERQETRDLVDQANADMKDELEYWLNDKLASYGHCLDHHHDDSALPPRNLFLDFPTMGRLVRSRSDETLSASDYSGKHRKKDFYASRHAAMQQIRGWDMSVLENQKNKRVINGSKVRHREQGKNVSLNNSKTLVTQAEVHTDNPDGSSHQNVSKIALSPSTNSNTSPSNINGFYGQTNNVGTTTSTSGWQQADRVMPHSDSNFQDSPREKGNSQHRVTFSPNQQQYNMQHPIRSASSPPPQGVPRSSTTPVGLSQHGVRSSSAAPPYNTPARSHPQFSSNQNLDTGGPPNVDPRSGEQGGSRNPSLSGHYHSSVRQSSKTDMYFSRINNQSTENDGHILDTNVTRYRDGHCASKYSRSQTLSTDSVLDCDYPHTQHISRCRSLENTLDEGDQNLQDFSRSGYVTDSAVKPTSSSNYNGSRIHQGRHGMRDTRSTSPAPRTATRYRLPETSSASNPARPESRSLTFSNSNKGTPAQGVSPAQIGRSENVFSDQNRSSGESPSFDNTRDLLFSSNKSRSIHSLNNSTKSPSTSLNTFRRSEVLTPRKPASANNLEPNLAVPPSPIPFTSSMKECLQHNQLVPTSAPPSATYNGRNKEDSTCSSNQDSGYGSRNHGGGLKGGIDTSAGTPSSSFSLERSACNTPSNAGSPYTTAAELSNSDSRNLVNESSGQSSFGTPFQYSSPHVHSKSNNSSLSNTTTPLFRPSSLERDRAERKLGNEVSDGGSSSFHSRPMSSSHSDGLVQHPGQTLQNYSINDLQGFKDLTVKEYRDNVCRYPEYNASNSDERYVDRMTSDTVGQSSYGLSNRGYGDDSFRNNTAQSTVRQVESSQERGQDSSRRNLNYTDVGNSQVRFNPAHRPQTPSDKGSSQSPRDSITPSKSFPPKLSSWEQNNNALPVSQTPRQRNWTPVKDSQRTVSSNNQKVQSDTVGPHYPHSSTRNIGGQGGLYPTPSEPPFQNSRSSNEDAVQAHIQGWYQRKLMEAAQRLRQNHGYNQPSVVEQENMQSGSYKHQDYYSRQDTSNTRQYYAGNSANTSSMHSSSVPHRNPQNSTTSRPQHQQSGQQQSLSTEPSHPRSVVNLRDRFEQNSQSQRNNNANVRGQYSDHYRPAQADRANGRNIYEKNVPNYNSNVQQTTSWHTSRFDDSSGSYNVNRNDNLHFVPHTAVPIRYDPVHGSDV